MLPPTTTDARDTSVRLRSPMPNDRARFLEAASASTGLHYPWVSPPSSPVEYQQWLTRAADNRHAAFLVECDQGLVGVINVNEIVRGAFRSAFLGYYAFSPLAGSGRMRAGMALALDQIFGPRLDLHRVEANIQPANTRSAALVRSLGFLLEGHSPDYLFIEGAWRDHDRYALLAPEWAAFRQSSG